MHKFHIPVLGLGFSIDTPLKVARYGIASTVSIVDDELTERMREYHALQQGIPYKYIRKTEPDARARRITVYLNLLNNLVEKQFTALQQQPFNGSNDIDKYFYLLPDDSALKKEYLDMLDEPDAGAKLWLQQTLRKRMRPGSIDVNIMSKVDKMNYDKNGEFTGDINTDALCAMRGFALSDVTGSLVLSAGLNPRLYSYMEQFDDFFPDEHGWLRKKIILKVSDFRSALIQAKFLAKKGLWVSEFRIESGLNCGGHAFATDGLLLGPILEEFKQQRQNMLAELREIYCNALEASGQRPPLYIDFRVTVQGGIGTAGEQDFLLQYYGLDGAGWGSPFLLVPEVTNVDNDTLQRLANAKQDDYYISDASPLGILFNNFKGSTAEQQRLERIERNRPGSPCTKKYLCSNTEFTERPICTASREYQHLKLEQLRGAGLDSAELAYQTKMVTQKICLCEGLCSSAFIKNGMIKPRESKAVAICPGPNLAYFSDVYTLNEMVHHIYGRDNLLNDVYRPHIFINELELYITYFIKETERHHQNFDIKKHKYLYKFKQSLQDGISYYRELLPRLYNQTIALSEQIKHELSECERHLNTIIV